MIDEISKSISRINTNTKPYSIHFVEDKDLYLRELEEENNRLKEELAKSNKYAEALFTQSFTAVALMDRDYNFIRVNEMYAQEDHRNVDEFPGHNHFEFYPSETRRELFDYVVNTKKTYREFATPYFFSEHPKGEVTYWDWTLDPVLDTKGEVELLILNLNDVTKHIRDKAKLAESEERYRVIYENSLDGILLTTLEGDVITANPAACSMFGASEEELCALGRNKMVDLEDPMTDIAFMKRQITGSYSSELTHVRKDGTKFPTEVTSKLFKDSKGRILSSVIIRDITHRKQSEAALRWSEEKFSQAFGNNQAAMSFTDLKDNKLIDFNRKFSKLFGYSREELIGKTSVNFWVDPNDREELLREIQRIGYVENFEIQYRKRTGGVGSLLVAASILDIEEGKYILCSMIDITERKKTEEDLRLSQEQFFKVFNANPLPMGILSIKQGTILEVNETFLQINPGRREELIGLKLVDVDIGCDSYLLGQFIEEIKERGFVKNLEINYRNKSGEMLTVLLSGVIMGWKGEECILAICNDITALRRYEHEMTRLDRLELIGKISASIAHEIRNPMTTVKGFLQLFSSKDRYHEDQGYIDLMIEELDRANAIITEFLSLARNKDLCLKWGNLNDKILALLPLLQADGLRNDVNIRLYLEVIPNVMFDEAEIRQLLLNLVRNGIEAMSTGSELVIETYANENEVTLIVKDQGLGIPPEIIDKIGTPFFTTKDHGTGLGLAVCYSIADRHHARIEIETSSAGTLFRVIFPTKWGGCRVS